MMMMLLTATLLYLLRLARLILELWAGHGEKNGNTKVCLRASSAIFVTVVVVALSIFVPLNQESASQSVCFHALSTKELQVWPPIVLGPLKSINCD